MFENVTLVAKLGRQYRRGAGWRWGGRLRDPRFEMTVAWARVVAVRGVTRGWVLEELCR